MSRINTNVQSLLAQRVLGQNNFQLSRSLERLSTGIRVNRGKDDPAGLIASENLRSELAASNAAVKNAERADQVVNIAEGGLQEVSGLLTELQGLLTASANSAGLSTEEKEANQLQIDSILQTIDRVAQATNFQGQKLLNGNFDYQTSNVDTGVADFKVNGAKFDGASQDVDVVVTGSAQQAGLYLSLGGANLDLQGTGGTFTIEVSGALGSRELSFASGTSLSVVANTINTFSEVTGLTASASGTGVAIQSSGFGSSEFSSVKVVDDGGVGTASSIGVYGFEADDATTVDSTSFDTFDSGDAENGIRDAGQNVAATINGISATTNGRSARINTDFLDVEVDLTTTRAQSLGSITAFEITGGGADFQLAGNVDVLGKVSLGVTDVAARKLGKTEDGSSFRFLDDLASGQALNVVDGDVEMAQKVVDEAVTNITALRGRLGAFQKNTVGATIRSLGVAIENTAAAESVIRDTDFAAETAQLTRSQILVSASTNTLSLANTQPQTALQLLG